MKRLLIPALLVLGLACSGGGGGGATSQPSTPPPPVAPEISAYEGPWKGTLTSSGGGTVAATAMITNSGELAYSASNNVAARGMISGYPAISAAGTLYPRTGGQLPDGTSTGRFTLTGTGTAWHEMSGTYTGAGDTGTFHFAYDAQALYDKPVIMANVAGAYTSTASTSGTTINGTLTPDGTFTGTDTAGGTFSGVILEILPDRNCFRTTIDYGLAGQSYRYQGLAYFAFGGQTVLNLMATGATGQFSGTFAKH